MLSLTVCIRALFSVQYQEKCVVHQQGFKQTLLSVLRFWRFVVEGEGGLGGGGGCRKRKIKPTECTTTRCHS